MDITVMEKPERLCVLYDNNVLIGWCQTWQEADYICEKMPNLQWEMKKTVKITEDIPLIIASVICN